jgi:hypothetical protein
MSASNPLNIKAAGSKWAGMIRVDDRGHAVFADAPHGWRAAVRTLQQKCSAGKNTLAAICRDWAPPSDTIGSIAGNAPNDPIDYARFVAKRVGISEQDRITLFDASGPHLSLLMRVLRAMAIYENGHDYAMRDSEIMMGIALWMRDFGEGKR